MTAGGWIMMLGSTAFVWSLAVWCYYKVMTAPAQDEVALIGIQHRLVLRFGGLQHAARGGQGAELTR